jgi:hypothetical protein
MDMWKTPEVSSTKIVHSDWWFGRRTESTTRANPIKDYHYDVVKHLVEERGFTFTQALVLVTDMCPDCVNVAHFEIELDYNALKSYRPYSDGISCPYCHERKKQYDPKRTNQTSSEQTKG